MWVCVCARCCTRLEWREKQNKERNTFWVLCQSTSEAGKVRSGDGGEEEMETDEKESPGADVTLRARC